MTAICTDPTCETKYRHYHGMVENSITGEWFEAIVSSPEDFDPRAEIRDSETGEVIFRATKGPLKLIVNPDFPAAPDAPTPMKDDER